MKSLYFRVPTVESATRIVQELRKNGISDSQVTVVGKDHYHLQMAHLREAGILQTTDLLHSLVQGIIVGFFAGLIVGFLLWAFPIEGLELGLWSFLSLGIVGGLFGAWGSSLIGISIPNPIIHQCEQAIELGEFILFIQVPSSREKEITAIIKSHHPEALIESLRIRKKSGKQ